MSPSSASQTESDALTGFENAGNAAQHQLQSHAHDQSRLQLPLRGVSGLAYLAEPADVLSPIFQLQWKGVLQSEQTLPFIDLLIVLLHCDQKTRQNYYQQRFVGEPGWAVQFISPRLFDIDEDTWRMIKDLPADERTPIFAARLKDAWEGHRSSPRSPGRSPSPGGRPRRNSIATSFTSTNALSSNSPGTSGSRELHIHTGGSDRSSNAGDKHGYSPEARCASLKRKHEGLVFYCPVPDCEHKPEGFVNFGSCKGHVKNSHSIWISNNPDWVSCLVPAPQRQVAKRQMAPTAAPSSFHPSAMSSPSHLTMTHGAGGIFPNEQQTSPHESYASTPLRQQFEQDAIDSNDPFSASGSNIFPPSSFALPSNFGPSNSDGSQQYTSAMRMLFPDPTPPPTFVFSPAPKVASLRNDHGTSLDQTLPAPQSRGMMSNRIGITDPNAMAYLFQQPQHQHQQPPPSHQPQQYQPSQNSI